MRLRRWETRDSAGGKVSFRFLTVPAALLAAALAVLGCGDRDRGRGAPPPPPEVVSVEPFQGDVAGGTLVLVTTQGFPDDFQGTPPEVWFGAAGGTFVAAPSPATVQVRTPPSPSLAWVDVTVRSGSGSPEATLSPGYEYTAGPPGGCTISDVTPRAGPVAGGTEVTITGSGFPASPEVTFGLAPAAAVFPDSDTQVRAVTPPGAAAETVAISVFDAGAGVTCTAADAFTYELPPPPPDCAITAVCPDEGDPAGGETVTISGTDFRDPPRVFFGSAESPQVTLVSAQAVEAEAPPVGGPTTVDVRVDNPTGDSCQVAAAYTYRTTGFAPDIWESNDSLAACIGVARPFSEATLNIAGTEDNDFFCLVLLGADTVNVAVTPGASAGNIDVELLEKSSGIVLQGSYQPTGPESIAATLGPGEYAVRVFGVCGDFGVYALDIN